MIAVGGREGVKRGLFGGVVVPLGWWVDGWGGDLITTVVDINTYQAKAA